MATNCTQQVRILAQPKAYCRERYYSEMNHDNHRANRFLRTDQPDFDYPTIEIPDIWRQKCTHIRVTLVTVPWEQAPERYVHPYPIITPDSDAILHKEMNTIYFAVSDDERQTGRKSFRIRRAKLTQHDLRNIRSLCLVDTSRPDENRIDSAVDPRQIINTYQLGKSQLLFSVVGSENGSPFVIYATTSVYSDIMSAPVNTANNENIGIKFAPPKGSWDGGETVLMFIPDLDKRKPCEIYFEYPGNSNAPVTFKYIDVKTLEFKTPRCPFPENSHHSVVVPIVVTYSGTKVKRVNFLYHTPDRCLNCDRQAIFDSCESSNSSGAQSTTVDQLYLEDDFDFDDNE
ncbi:unnamed protein product [Adineta ricciae]|uniref:Uncharacterized protein n=1 Tax=Adineta ricciae TaxID=249248 RepID=A0A814C5B9_ADIRI|nr:unnamed protein product [Adineta ricciae]CAF1295222.1 unnamed protein product [Adineta ricciae]